MIFTKQYATILKDIVLFVDKDQSDKHLEAFIALLQEENVLSNIEKIMIEAEILIKKEVENATIELTFSRESTEELLSEIEKAVKKKMESKGKKEIFINTKTDESLISGVRIDFPGMRIDSSLSARTANLVKQMSL